MAIYWTERFKKSLYACVQKELVYSEIAELDHYVSNRIVSHKKSKKLVGDVGDNAKKQGVTLMQWDINSEARLLYGDDNNLLLIDFSKDLRHDCLETFSKLSSGQIRDVLGKRELVPESFVRLIKQLQSRETNQEVSLSRGHGGENRIKYPQEKTREWVTFLDKPQLEVSSRILSSIASQPMYQLHVILGGAGTGKTMVLRDLAHKVWLQQSMPAQLRVPAGVRDFLITEGASVPGLPPFAGDYIAILLDDPITIEDVNDSLDDAKAKNIPIVIAIDPVQWHERRALEKFEKILRTDGVTEHHLTLNYRQGSDVGQPAIDAIKLFRSNSSEFTDPFREEINKSKGIRFEQLSLDDVEFAERAGTYVFHPKEDFSLGLALDEFHHVGRFVTERAWPKLLIGTRSKQLFPVGIPDLLMFYQELDDTFRFKQRAFSQYREVRGTEFESVILFVPSATWRDLIRGVKGAKDARWESLNAPLTFLTRAENRCVVFEIPDDLEHVGMQVDQSTLEHQALKEFFENWLENATS